MIESIKQEIIDHPSNRHFTDQGWLPLFSAHENSKIVLIGQAPGIRAQTSMVPWDDISGKRLLGWLGVTVEEFYDPENFALIPMDFYYPGKGKSGDLPPRKDFAETWHTKLFKNMKNVKMIILVGQYAQGYYLGTNKEKTLTETVSNYKKYLPKYFPLPHPSPRNGIWLRKNIWFEDDIIPELQEIIKNIL